ncbi:MAG: choice-of-anchor B family protein [Bacteroidetes bacterium]|nr:MAG: choice-of-anchor B family protein [Bacteroidota bacterium]
MKKHILALVAFVVMGMVAHAQTNVTFLNQKTYSANLNDVWGYVDADSNEYALVGVRNGFSVVDVTDPSNLVEQFFIPGKPSTWRDIKTWDHFAYVMHDYAGGASPNNGLLIVDLDSMTNPTYEFMYPKYIVNDSIVADSATRSHNLWIDENGFLYIFGADVALGGALIYDIATDPWHPDYVGIFNSAYLHDGYVRNDTLYGAALTNGMVISNVSNKSQPQYLASFQTPGNFAHNCWLSDDGKTIFTTDEISSGYIAAYDISNFSNIGETDRFRVTPNNQTIPHNAHVLNEFVVTSYYTYGLQILDAKDPSWLIEVGQYDSSPLSGDGYDGAWGAYPFLPSGNALITDIQEGLFVVSPSYTAAARLYGSVEDSVSGTLLPNAKVYLKANADSVVLNPLDASFKRHHVGSFIDTIEIKMAGYRDLKLPVSYLEGGLDTVVFKMLPIDFSVSEENSSPLVMAPNPAIDAVTIQSEEGLTGAEVSVIDLTGKVVYSKAWNPGSTEMKLNLDLASGVYLIKVSGSKVNWTERLVIR